MRAHESAPGGEEGMRLIMPGRRASVLCAESDDLLLRTLPGALLSHGLEAHCNGRLILSMEGGSHAGSHAGSQSASQQTLWLCLHGRFPSPEVTLLGGLAG